MLTPCVEPSPWRLLSCQVRVFFVVVDLLSLDWSVSSGHYSFLWPPMQVPVFFVVTKVDIAPEHILKQTVQVRHVAPHDTVKHDSTLCFPALAGPQPHPPHPPYRAACLLAAEVGAGWLGMRCGVS